MSSFSKHKILKRFYKPVYNLTSASTPNFNLFTELLFPSTVNYFIMNHGKTEYPKEISHLYKCCYY